MDVGFYLGELLMQQGEVKVPGLGIFSQKRMSAYYDENKALFYPPYNKVHFEAQTQVEDSALADYLISKKGISIASATYFIEKYIGNLRLQAVVADVPVSNIGTFYTDSGQLSFKPNDGLTDDPELYGFAPVKINKAYTEPVSLETEPESEFTDLTTQPEADITELTDTEASQAIVENEPESVNTSSYDEEAADIEEDEEIRRGPWRGILIAFIIAAILGAGIYALYVYQPATFNKLQFWENNGRKAPVKVKPNIIAIPKIDTLHTDSAETPLNDSAASKSDTLKAARFELITGNGFESLAKARAAMKKYRAAGLADAKLSEDIPGPLIKISVGSFNTVRESEAMRQKLITEKKLTDKSYTLELSDQQ